LGSLIGTLTTYALIAFINNMGSTKDVGFYQACNMITVQYTGLVFTAMATDYYPHLSSLIKTNITEAFRTVNQQTEITMLIITPLAMIMTLTAPLAIRILLTEEFLSIERMVCFMALATVLKALCFARDYIIYAKGDNKIIFWVETVWGSAKTFIIMSLFYYFLGLDGLGYGALCVSVVEVIVSLILIPWRYNFRFTRKTINLIIITTVMATICLLGSLIPSTLEKYAVMSIINAICIVYCAIQLNKRMNLRAIISRYKNRHKKEED
jgi:O-antigen/teichoic acid export membrane protein